MYTAPGSTTTVVKQVVATNTTDAQLTFSLSLVPSGGTAGVTNRIADEIPVAGNNVVVLDLYQILGTGDFLAGLVSAAGLVLTISGVEVT